MTRDKALQVSSLLYKIENYETLIDEITGLQALDELAHTYGEHIEEELIAVVQLRLDKLNKELEEL
jgi:hypothetical protein